MKKIYFLLIVTVMIFGGFTQQKSPKIEGAWKFVYAKSISGGTLQSQFPGDYTGSDMKMWSKNHFSFVGHFERGPETHESYGGGTYTLKGNRYDETIVYHATKTLIGQTIKMIIEVKNDTLYQTWPVDDNGKIDPANYMVEKYIRF